MAQAAANPKTARLDLFMFITVTFRIYLSLAKTIQNRFIAEILALSVFAKAYRPLLALIPRIFSSAMLPAEKSISRGLLPPLSFFLRQSSEGVRLCLPSLNKTFSHSFYGISKIG
jgi:hypothetical protein